MVKRFYTLHEDGILREFRAIPVSATWLPLAFVLGVAFGWALHFLGIVVFRAIGV